MSIIDSDIATWGELNFVTTIWTKNKLFQKFKYVLSIIKEFSSFFSWIVGGPYFCDNMASWTKGRTLFFSSRLSCPSLDWRASEIWR